MDNIKALYARFLLSVNLFHSQVVKRYNCFFISDQDISDHSIHILLSQSALEQAIIHDSAAYDLVSGDIFRSNESACISWGKSLSIVDAAIGVHVCNSKVSTKVKAYVTDSCCQCRCIEYQINPESQPSFSVDHDTSQILPSLALDDDGHNDIVYLSLYTGSTFLFRASLDPSISTLNSNDFNFVKGSQTSMNNFVADIQGGIRTGMTYDMLQGGFAPGDYTIIVDDNESRSQASFYTV